MAISGKPIGRGGTYYKGYVVTVASTPGVYSLVITNTDGAALSGLSATCDTYGAGDTWGFKHMADAAGTGRTIQILAEGIYNAGAGAPVNLDLPGLQLINPQQSLKFSYVNTASKAMNVYLLVEWAGVRKTA